MSIMAKLSKQSAVAVNTKFDDLTAIKGIREARQQWFRDTMKVNTYIDFAMLSVDQIEAGLKVERQFPSRNMIAAWIAQAKALAEMGENQTGSTKRDAAVIPRWKSLASFVIEFQEVENKDGSREQRMTAHHIETDKNHVWWEIEPQESMRWILAEAGIETRPAAAVPTAESLDTLTPVYPTGYSDKLQQVLAKSQQLSSAPKSMQAAQPTPTTSRPTGFSDHMRQVLARTQGS
jgi:hypothetical protein